MVRFASTCDRCGQRTEEYTAWPTCTDCHDHICPDCDVPDLRVNNEGRLWTCCRGCAADSEGTV